MLVLPNGPGFLAAFLGAERMAAVPVPLFPGSGSERIADLAGACGARIAVLPRAADGDPEVASSLEAQGFQVLRLGEEETAAAEVDLPDLPRPQDLAWIQYTSGSTGDPKGVMIPHAHLLTNARQMIAGMEITRRDIFVSWLPLCHDMGLVLMALVPLLVGARLVLLPSTLTDVRTWLSAIAEHRGTFTAAPDFAYRLCLHAVRNPSRFDLSSLRVALDAAEAVRAQTLEAFHETFGLRRVVVPGYGLAEATVGVSMQAPGTTPKVSERGFVALGKPFPGVRMEVRVGGRPAAVGEIGELIVHSPAVTPGYYANPEATAELFAEPGALCTGDLAFRDEEGDIFWVGRAKSIILQAGRNLAPREIEEVVERLPFVRRAAAVGIDRGRLEGEQAYVFVELKRMRRASGEELQEQARRVVEAFHRRLGVRPGRVVLLRPRSIPLTDNGKIRYPALKEAFLEGRLQAQGRVLYPP